MDKKKIQGLLFYFENSAELDPGIQEQVIGVLNDDIGIYQLNNILPIEIKRNNYEQKINISLHFEETFPLFPEIGVPFGYKTNINDIPNLVTEKIIRPINPTIKK